MKKWILFGGLIASIVLIYAFVSPRYLFAPEPVCHTGGLFERFDDPLSEEYQAAVREVLQGKTPADFRYFFRTFLEEEDGAYLLVNGIRTHISRPSPHPAARTTAPSAATWP